MNKILKASILFSIIIITLILINFSLEVFATNNTCPQDNGWTKIDSDDLSSYPVASASAYCFKAGSDNSQGCEGGIFSQIPEGGFEKPYCGLSHWSYFIPESTPTPEPSIEPSPSATPSASPSSSPTPTPQPSNSPSPTPSNSPTPTTTPQEQQRVVIEQIKQENGGTMPDMGFK